MDLPDPHLHPDVLIILGAVWGAYLWAWHVRARRIPAGLDGDRRKRIALFSSGMAVLLVVSTWPVHDIAERALYSIHMVQHMSYQLIAAPLLLVGIPAWMWRSILRPPWLMETWRRITRPVPALIIFNGVLLFTHWPAVVELTLRSEPAHFVAHSVVVLSAVIMWWPIFSPLPEAPAITPPLQMLYLFLQSIAPTIPASFLTFGQHPLYKIYETFPRLWDVTAISDQRVAGLIMKVGGGLIIWGYITVIFFRWYFEEQRNEGWDALQMQGVERDVRTGLTR